MKVQLINSTSQHWGAASGSVYTAHEQRKYLNQTERKAFLKAVRGLPEQQRLFCLTLLWTGCRISEALALSPYQVAWHEQMVVFRTLKKRGRAVYRHVPVPAPYLNCLCVMSGESADALFWPWTRKQGWRLVKTVMQEAGIVGPMATARGLRHAFGVHAVLCGVPLNKIQKWMGHADISVTAIYTDVVGAEEIEVARRMWADA